MDLTTAAVNFQQAKVIGQVQMAVAAKLLKTQKDQGNAAIQLLDAASGNCTQAGDALVAAATGLGGNLDTCG